MEFANLETSFSETVGSLEHEREMKTKALENQERLNEELKQKIENQDTEHRKAMDKMRHENVGEKDMLYKKIEELQNNLRAVEKETAKACSQRDQNEKMMQMKERNLTEIN